MVYSAPQGEPFRARSARGSTRPSRPGRRLAKGIFNGALSIAIAGLLAIAGVLGHSVTQPTVAHAHDVLVHVGGEIEAADASQLTLTLTLGFNNVPVGVGAEIHAFAIDGSPLSTGDPVYEGRQVHQVLTLPGFDEAVTVHWRVVSSDGHPITDSLAFKVHERDGGTEFELVELPDPAPGLEPQGDSDSAEDADGESDSAGDSGNSGDSNSSDTANEERDPTIMAMFLGGAGLVVITVVVIAVYGSRKRREAIAREAAQGDE